MPKDLFFSIPDGKRSRIMEASINEFSRQMFNNASINQIIKEADISRGSFYQYFEDKDDLYFFTIQSIIKATAYTFLKQFMASQPQDIYSVYRSLFVYNLQLLSDGEYKAFFRNMYFGLNYRLQQKLKAIFSSIRGELLEYRLNELQQKSGYDGPYFQELMNILELNNRDLLMLYISRPMDIETIMDVYDLRIRVIRTVG
ncbi:hypothetical protein A7K91_14300 [Paenibacillus oryzae]|uniref:HTH tetR-type domain-containing protein n=2 Tax=Paenibacillus oryzae TaxID=1844972 RepID=A0A1A5YJF3_9BACL|nr:hypothetical protein A7K91_14300 [Paenibacillus oryzae]